MTAADGGTARRRWLRHLLRSPLLHFLAAGGLLFAARSWPRALRAPVPQARSPIVFTAQDVDALRREWREEHGSAPDRFQEQALVDRAIDAEVLYREARARGLERGDRAVRLRLLKLGRFLDLSSGGEEGVLREARAVGLDRSDTVIRRYLIEMMRLALAKPAPSDLPTEAEVRRYCDEHARDLGEPARVSFTHVFLSADRHGAAVEKDASDLLARLRLSGSGRRAGAGLGDPFVRGAHLTSLSRSQIERIFGPGFAAAVAQAPLQAWSGPVRSSYGLHLVWIDDRVAAHAPPLEAVRNQIVHHLLHRRGADRLRARLRVLRAKYPIEVGGGRGVTGEPVSQ